MLTKQQLLEIVTEQSENFKKKRLIKRLVDIPTESTRVVIVSGIRRCGKSTLIRQIFQDSGDAIYLNFEDPRLIGFTVEDFIRLEQILTETGKSKLILDEVQNIDKWEIYARSANEKGIPLFVTGSNASMLSRELGTHLTGRYRQIELFPFNYSEFLSYFNLEKNIESFEKFLTMGGFPEFYNENDPDYYRTLLKDIITRDIAVRRKISNENQLIRLAVHLLSNIGKEFSFNNISKSLEFKSVRTVIDYCDYLKESYLIELIPLFSFSIKKQLANAKKAYCTDTALATANSLSFSKDLGRKLENMVYNKIRQSNKEIFYFKSATAECDFLIKQQEKINSAIQVCWEINSGNIDRELKGIKNAAKETGATDVKIITFNQADNIDGIPLIPAWQWL